MATVHQRIVEAAKRGVGLRLKPSEVQKLAADDAIRTAAEYDDDHCPHGLHVEGYCAECDDDFDGRGHDHIDSQNKRRGRKKKQ